MHTHVIHCRHKSTEAQLFPSNHISWCCCSYLVAPWVLDPLVAHNQAGLVLLSGPCILRTDTILRMMILLRWRTAAKCLAHRAWNTVSRISINAITQGCNLYICPGTHTDLLLDETNIIIILSGFRSALMSTRASMVVDVETCYSDFQVSIPSLLIKVYTGILSK